MHVRTCVCVPCVCVGVWNVHTCMTAYVECACFAWGACVCVCTCMWLLWHLACFIYHILLPLSSHDIKTVFLCRPLFFFINFIKTAWLSNLIVCAHWLPCEHSAKFWLQDWNWPAADLLPCPFIYLLHPLIVLLSSLHGREVRTCIRENLAGSMHGPLGGVLAWEICPVWFTKFVFAYSDACNTIIYIHTCMWTNSICILPSLPLPPSSLPPSPL